MTVFFVALSVVAVILTTAVPGYLLRRRGMISESCIPGCSKILLYLCQPCLYIYTFHIPFTVEKLRGIGIFAAICLTVHAVMLGVTFLLLNKKSRERVLCRILTLACAFGNCGFFGIPVIEALMPAAASEVIIYTTVYAFIMNMIAWTVGSAIIARDVHYINAKTLFLNPTMIGFVIGMLIFVTGFTLPADLAGMITATARMSTPLSMLIMGMRLAGMDFRRVFTNRAVYAAVAVKQLVMPLIAFALVYFLPISLEIKETFFITCACPIASIVLNFSEIIGEGQEDAANAVLLGTMLSIVTLPIVSLLLPLLA